VRQTKHHPCRKDLICGINVAGCDFADKGRPRRKIRKKRVLTIPADVFTRILISNWISPRKRHGPWSGSTLGGATKDGKFVLKRKVK
jgi:hypothetical protein